MVQLTTSARALLVLALALGACDRGIEGSAGEPASASASIPATVAPLEHDFGVIPHGDRATHDFVLQIPGGNAGYVPVGFRSGCSCAGHRFVIRRGDEEREVDAAPRPYKTLQHGDELLLRMTIDTNYKEAVDQPRRTLQGTAIVQPAEGDEPYVELPLVFHFAIDALVTLRPAAHVDIGTVPLSHTYSQTLELQLDPAHQGVVLGPARVDDRRVALKLHDEDGLTLLDVHFDPSKGTAQPGPVRATIQVGTNLPSGYAVRVPISGQVVDDIVVGPFRHVSFGRIDMSEPREKFVNLTDHREDRPAGFVLDSIRSITGAPLEQHFEIRLVPIVGDPRATRLHLRYLGTIDDSGFRGVVRVAKENDPSIGTEITFVGFDKRT